MIGSGSRRSISIFSHHRFMSSASLTLLACSVQRRRSIFHAAIFIMLDSHGFSRLSCQQSVHPPASVGIDDIFVASICCQQILIVEAIFRFGEMYASRSKDACCPFTSVALLSSTMTTQQLSHHTLMRIHRWHMSPYLNCGGLPQWPVVCSSHLMTH